MATLRGRAARRRLASHVGPHATTHAVEANEVSAPAVHARATAARARASAVASTLVARASAARTRGAAVASTQRQGAHRLGSVEEPAAQRAAAMASFRYRWRSAHASADQ